MIKAAAITAATPLAALALLAVLVQVKVRHTDPRVVAAADAYMRADCEAFAHEIIEARHRQESLCHS